MVLQQRTFREQLEDIGESPPCLWEDELKKRMSKIWPLEDMLATPRYYGRIVLSPFSNILGDASRIEAVNEYFRVKAGQVFGNAKALEVLSDLRAKEVIPRDEWGQLAGP